MEEQKEYLAKNACRSLCWRCSKGTNMYKCEWVKYCSMHTCIKHLSRECMLKHMPKGIELDKENYVISCPNYESDGLIWTIEEKAKSLGISVYEYKKRLAIQKVIKLETELLNSEKIEIDEKPIKIKPFTEKQLKQDQKRKERKEKQKLKIEELKRKLNERELKRKLKESELEIKKSILNKEQKQLLLSIEDLLERNLLKDDMLFAIHLGQKIKLWEWCPVLSLESIEFEAKDFKIKCATLRNEEIKNKILIKLEQSKQKKINSFNEHQKWLKEIEEEREKKKRKRRE